MSVVAAASALVLPFVVGLPAGALAAHDQRATADSTRLPTAVDSIVESAVRSGEIPGATLVVVKDGATVLARGYGLADLERRLPASADSTLFGVSSVSKVFTALAVLALAQDGRVRLDDDVNRYLRGVRVPAAYTRPVTLADLLTHTAGFDEAPIGIAARTIREMVPLGTFLGRELPPRVRPAGQVASYSNHGFALAGLVVEHASGVPFADYVTHQVLAPLGMRHSSFAQPLPARLEERRATGYQKSGERWLKVPRIYFNDAPAAALFTTGRDMARFLAASLPADSSDGSPVLRAEWLATMYRRQFGHHPRFPGLAYGFRERFDDGRRALQQGGDWQDYSSELYLVPEARLGLFIAFNTGEGSEVGERVWRVVHSYFAPGGAVSAALPPSPTGVAAAGDSGRAAMAPPTPAPRRALAGAYRMNRYSRSTLARVAVVAGAVTELTVDARGDSLHALGTTLHPTGPLLFRRADTGTLVAFRTDPSGRATHLFAEKSPYVSFERVAWTARPVTHLALLGASLLALLTAFVVAPMAFVRRGAGIRGARDDGPVHLPRDYGRATLTLVLAASVVTIGLVVAFGAILVGTDSWALQYGLPGTVRAALVGALLVPAVAVALAARVAAAWARGEWGVAVRLHHSLLVLAIAAVALFLFHWRLMALRA